MFGYKGEHPARAGFLAGEVDHLSGWACDVDMVAARLDADLPDDPDRHRLPADLDDWLPGPYLAVVLSSLGYSRLSGDDVVTGTRAWDRLLSHVSGRRYAGAAKYLSLDRFS